MGEKTLKPLVSIDVFDTALFRKVYKPTDIFNLAEDELGHGFKARRIEAQNKARKKSIYYNILDIYKEMVPTFNPKVEISLEYKNCVANPYILNMYNNGEADYIFISDMYLPAPIIKSMLESCGYSNPRVFVSCDLKAVKGDGSLFKKVEEILGRKIDKHIGDNYQCDILGAKKVRIPKVEYTGPALSERKVMTPELDSVKLRKLLIDNERSGKPIEERIGYIFAPLILEFTRKVLEDAKGNQTVFFNARDGFIMYVIARWVLKTDKNIKYCRFSRKSCFLANILTSYSMKHPLNAPSLSFFRIQRIRTLRDFLRTFGLSEHGDYSRILEEYNITMDTVIDIHPNRHAILEKTVIAAQDEIYAKVKVERSNFFKYLKRIGMKNGDIFVDLGYNGTIQGMIKKISHIDTKGRYINTYKPQGEFQGVSYEMKSFLPILFMRAFGGAAVELIFSEARGTVIGYDDDGLPILTKDFEYRQDVTKKILKGVLKGVKDLLDEEVRINVSDCVKILKRYYEEPTIEEATFANQRIFENGSYEENESVTWFDKDKIRQGKVKECYNRSYWKAAFKVLLKNDPDYSFMMKYVTQ